MIKIEKHARGLAIYAEEGLDRNEQTRQLELRLAAYQAIVSGGRLIASSQATGAILEILGVDNVVWDADLLRAAKHQLDQRSLQAQARLEVARSLEDPYRTLAGYEHLHLLDRHQVEGMAAIVAPSLRGIAIFDEQGTGKTIMALAAFDWLRERGTVQRLLVVAPKSVLAAWQIQCDDFLGRRCKVILLDGSAAARRRSILSRHDILLVGYETAVRSEGLLCTVVFARPSSYMLVVDESYFVKNPATARSRVVGRLRSQCERALILCGAPAPNSAIDIVNQIDVADRGVSFAGRIIPTEEGAATAEIADVLQTVIYIRRLKEDVLPEIPPKRFEKVYLDLASRQRALYDQARDLLATEVKDLNDRQFRQGLASFLTKRVRLLQICSHPRMFDPLYDEIPAKLRALDHLLRELVEEQGQKVVIWSHFRASLDEIAQRYRYLGVARIDGTVTGVHDRLEAIARFQGDPSTRLFVGNAAAAGAGITLTAAHHAIYESFSNQAAHYLQSVDRIHRRGQVEHATSHVLIARDTIEEHEYRRLLHKERAGRELLGDPYKEIMTRERFLADLEISA